MGRGHPENECESRVHHLIQTQHSFQKIEHDAIECATRQKTLEQGAKF